MIPSPKDLIDVGQAGELVGMSKRSITYAITTGSRLRSGRPLQLRALALPGGFRTTEQWVLEFVNELTRDRTKQSVPAAVNDRAQKATAVLTATGW
jgi:hypothetical protein